MKDPRYDILFDSVQIGPVTSRNRFYQTPQCNGMGRSYPTSMAAMRGVKAEGGWGVVFAEQCDFHYTSDNTRNVRLWDEQDIPILARMTDMVHAHDSLAGLMLAHNGFVTPNIISRELPFSPSGGPAFGNFPTHTRAIDKADIRALHRWTRAAALNAKRAGFDIVNIYAAHDLALPFHFISRRHNRRSDEYGGSLENRVRLLRELIEIAKDAIGDKLAVGVRLSVDELIGPAGICADGEGRDVVEMLAELPDIWDVNVGAWPQDSISSRFGEEGRQEKYVNFVKQVTTKPVVGVGRFTSPDMMLGQIKRGVLDLIGAARPSIADPFLPEKIRTGATDDIRECIGCNMCVTNNYLMAPIRCTQNPTMSEEWRRGWHPERIPHKTTDDTVLIVGSGPAGLEAARAMGRRGYQVLLAEKRTELGGRVTRESRLPGLSAWGRVRDYRVQQLNKMPNVEIFLDSEMGVDEVAEADCSLVAIATGSRWRADGVGRHHATPISISDGTRVITPDNIMDGVRVSGHVVIYDDDHFYMGSVMAEALIKMSCTVTIVTPAVHFAGFAQFSLEIKHIHRRMAELGVTILAQTALTGVTMQGAEVEGVYGTDARQIACDAVMMVAGQVPNDDLYRALAAKPGAQRVVALGDCQAPATIASAVFAGHKFARDLGLADPDVVPFLREDVELSANLSGWGAPALKGAAE